MDIDDIYKENIDRINSSIIKLEEEKESLNKTYNFYKYNMGKRILKYYCPNCKLMIESISVQYNHSGNLIHKTCLSTVQFEYFITN